MVVFGDVRKENRLMSQISQEYAVVIAPTHEGSGLYFKVVDSNIASIYNKVYVKGSKEDMQRYADVENLKRGYHGESFWSDTGTIWEL